MKKIFCFLFCAVTVFLIKSLVYHYNHHKKEKYNVYEQAKSDAIKDSLSTHRNTLKLHPVKAR